MPECGPTPATRPRRYPVTDTCRGCGRPVTGNPVQPGGSDGGDHAAKSNDYAGKEDPCSNFRLSSDQVQAKPMLSVEVLIATNRLGFAS